MEVKDKKGEEVQCHFSRLFPIHYLYLQRKPEIPEAPLIEMVGPPRDAHLLLAYLALDQLPQ